MFPINNQKTRVQIKAKVNKTTKTIMIVIENKLEYDVILSNWRENTSSIEALNTLLWRAKSKDIDYRSFFMDHIVLHVAQWKIFAYL